jgi:hypothetical protein
MACVTLGFSRLYRRTAQIKTWAGRTRQVLPLPGPMNPVMPFLLQLCTWMSGNTINLAGAAALGEALSMCQRVYGLAWHGRTSSHVVS